MILDILLAIFAKIVINNVSNKENFNFNFF